MKNKFKRLSALVLALLMCLSITVSAADITETSKAKIVDPVTGANVTFTDTAGEKISITYESASIKEGQFYLVMVVTGTKNETTGDISYVPTNDSILYINQTTGVAGSTSDTGKIVFGEESNNVIYPSEIKDSAILIYGVGINGEASSLIAAIIDAKYIIGDVTGDGKVTSLDALMILQSLVGKATLNDEQKLAGNVDGTGTEPGALDALKILQFLVGKATL